MDRAERRGDGELRIEGAEGWTVDEVLGERIEDALANLVYEDILTENEADYADRTEEFGLDEPTLTVEVRYTDGTELRFRIGDDSGLEDEDFRYMTVDGDPRLYAVAGSLAEDLQVEQELLHPVVQPEIQQSRIDRITVMDGDENVVAEWSLAGSITDADAGSSWRVSFPVEYPVDQDQMVSLKKNAENLRVGLYVEEGSAGYPEKYGLDRPKRILEIHMAEGTTGLISDGGAYYVQDRPEQTVRFCIGDSRNEMTDYCLYDGTIYTINHFTAAAITETDPMTTLARYPVTVPLENLGRMEIIREDGSRDVYELTYTLVPPETEDGEAETVVTCRKNGEELEYKVFEAFYERWLTVDVSGRLPEGWEKKETQTTYVFQTLSGRTQTVELSPFDAMHDAVTVDGQTLFYLIKNGMGDQP